MIHIAICDDEAYIADKISELVTRFFDRKKLKIAVSRFLSGEDLLKHDKDFDILFLDIQMKGLDGMETARRLRAQNHNGFLIFVTILKEMVFQSFEVQAYDYLVKPIQDKYFEMTMERLLVSMQRADGHNSRARLLIQRGYESRLIAFDEIVFSEIIDRKVYLHLRSGDVIDYYDRIENLETKLDHRFFRCHRSYLINLNYVRGYKNGMAYMTGGLTVPVSRLRGREFSHVILQHMKVRG